MPSRRHGRGFREALLATLALVIPACAAAIPPAVFRDLHLQDHRARAVQPASLDGRVLLLNFVFTTCSTSCPLQTHELAQLRRGLPAAVRARTEFVSVSVDPLNDTPAALAAFARRLGAEQAGWRFVTGAPAQVDQLLARMQVLAPGGAAPADHRTSLWLFDHRGALVQRFAGAPLDRTRLADEIGRLALKAGP